MLSICCISCHLLCAKVRSDVSILFLTALSVCSYAFVATPMFLVRGELSAYKSQDLKHHILCACSNSGTCNPLVVVVCSLSYILSVHF